MGTGRFLSEEDSGTRRAMPPDQEEPFACQSCGSAPSACCAICAYQMPPRLETAYSVEATYLAKEAPSAVRAWPHFPSGPMCRRQNTLVSQ